MILKINNESKLFEDIKQNDKKVIIYGAGMVGKIVMPYLVCKYGIHSNIDCFVDADSQKVGNNIVISGISYKINSIDYLKKNGADKIILVTNTKFMSIIEFLNSIDTLNNSTTQDIDVDVTFGEYANPSFESQVETVSKAKQGGIMSVEASIDELYGDTKDDDWKQEEVARLKAEQGIEQMTEPELNTELDGFEVESF